MIEIKIENYCKGIGKITTGNQQNSFNYYSHGFKRCNECELFLVRNSYKCPSCNNILGSNLTIQL